MNKVIKKLLALLLALVMLVFSFALGEEELEVLVAEC